MEDGLDGGTTDTTLESGADQSGPAVDQGQTDTSGGHPAWQGLRDRLGDVPFKLIEPDLQEMDRKAQERFQAIHKEYEPLKQYQGLGLEVDQIKQYQQVIDLLNNDPVQFYQLLGQNPQIAAAMAEANGQTEDEGEEYDPNDLESNPAFQSLRQQNEQMMQMLQQRQQAEQQQQVEADLDTELNSYWGQHSEFNDADKTQTIRLWAQMVAQDQNATLDQAAHEVLAYKQSILSAPRPGANAPRVMPTNGSPLSPNSNVELGKMTSKDTRSLVADMLAAGKSQG